MSRVQLALAEGLPTSVEEQTTCCYALQDKVWVDDPDGVPWEVYTMLADAPETACASGHGCAPVGAGAGA